MGVEAIHKKRIKLLMRPEAYMHPVSSIELVETHLSWVLLTGHDAYKIKKPVHLDFVDFSTLDKRKHFCEEELRCNRAFAPELYLGVVPIVEAEDGQIRMGGEGQTIEWAVHMLQFPQDDQANRLLEGNRLTCDEMRGFGSALAEQHGRLPCARNVDQTGPLKSNFDTLNSLQNTKEYRPILSRLEAKTLKDVEITEALMTERSERGYVRECHGDLHLSNLVRTPKGIRAFDCLEFDAKLRNIDVWCDVGFLYMDCAVRERDDLGYSFVDGYLDHTGDYEGLTLLPLFARYRSMVRAKVAALRLEQSPQDTGSAAKMETHIEWTDRHSNRSAGRLIMMCGLSGSGKSHWAARLVPELQALRLRSDVLRKRPEELALRTSAGSGIAEGSYSSAQSELVYGKLARITARLLISGENVIVDAANLGLSQRQGFYSAAKTAGATCILLQLTAPVATLRDRIKRRKREGSDLSEADIAVLEWQRAHLELPTAAEPVLAVDTRNLTIQELLTLIFRFQQMR